MESGNVALCWFCDRVVHVIYEVGLSGTCGI